MALTKQQEIIAGVGLVAILAYFAFRDKGEKATDIIKSDDTGDDPFKPEDPIPALEDPKKKMLSKEELAQLAMGAAVQQGMQQFQTHFRIWDAQLQVYFALRARFQRYLSKSLEPGEQMGDQPIPLLPLVDEVPKKMLTDLLMIVDALLHGTPQTKTEAKFFGLTDLQGASMIQAPWVQGAHAYLTAMEIPLKQDEHWWIRFKGEDKEANIALLATEAPSYTNVTNNTLYQLNKNFTYIGPVGIFPKEHPFSSVNLGKGETGKKPGKTLPGKVDPWANPDDVADWIAHYERGNVLHGGLDGSGGSGTRRQRSRSPVRTGDDKMDSARAWQKVTKGGKGKERDRGPSKLKSKAAQTPNIMDSAFNQSKKDPASGNSAAKDQDDTVLANQGTAPANTKAVAPVRGEGDPPPVPVGMNSAPGKVTTLPSNDALPPAGPPAQVSELDFNQNRGVKRTADTDDPADFDTIENSKVRKIVDLDEETEGKSGNMFLQDGTKRTTKPKPFIPDKLKTEGQSAEGDGTYLKRVGDASGIIAKKLMDITSAGFKSNDKTVRDLVRELFGFYEKLIDTIPAGMDASRDYNMGFWTAARDYKEIKKGRQTDDYRTRWFQQAANVYTDNFPRPGSDDLLSTQRLAWVRESPEFISWFNEIVMTQNRLKELMPKYFGPRWRERGKNFGKIPSSFSDVSEI